MTYLCDMEFLPLHIESLLFASGQPVTFEEITHCLNQTFSQEFAEDDVRAAIEVAQEKYRADTMPFEIVAISGGWQFLTKPAYHGVIAQFLRLTTRKRLSQAALETLSIIAYKQPISKSELEQIRGVNCDYSMQKLLEKELVMVSGRSDGPGRPLLYSTSEKFMQYFGLRTMEELPKPKEFSTPENSIGLPEGEPAQDLTLADEPAAQ
jgi:segregation and condensation protein B